MTEASPRHREALRWWVVPRDELGAPEREAMFRLLARHFHGVTRTGFEKDLEGKNWVLLLEEGEGGDSRPRGERTAGRGLVGFTTLHLHGDRDHRGPCRVIFSGDTIVDPSAWGRSRLPQGWLEAVLRIAERDGSSDPLYWLLITSGFRTYRFLPLFWRWFFPRHDQATPPEVEDLLHRLARERFGDHFRAEEGIVRFPHPQRLRDRLAGIPDGRMEDPHIRFFHTRNPGADQGDELVCLTRIHEDNLTPAGARVLRAVRERSGA